MFAIVEIAGKQYKVTPKCQIFTDRLSGEIGSEIEIEKVLLVADGDKVHVGSPTVKGASIKASIEAAVRGDKVTVFKKKRRKGYRVRRGHRQPYTALRIDEITVK